MRIVKETVEQIYRQGGAANIQGWCYDLVVERLEQMGFVRHEGISGGSFEGSTYRNPKGEFKVVTNRFDGPMTIVKFTRSPEKPSN